MRAVQAGLGEEEGRPAEGAAGRHGHGVLRQAGADELGAGLRAQVQEDLAPARAEALRPEPLRDLRPHPITACPRVRAYASLQVTGLDAESLGQLGYGQTGQTGRQPAPAPG